MADQLVVRVAFTAVAAAVAGEAVCRLFDPPLSVVGIVAGAAVGEHLACAYTYANEAASTAIVAAAGGTGALLLGTGGVAESFLGGAAAAALGHFVLERALSSTSTSRVEEQHQQQAK